MNNWNLSSKFLKYIFGNLQTNVHMISNEALTVVHLQHNVHVLQRFLHFFVNQARLLWKFSFRSNFFSKFLLQIDKILVSVLFLIMS